MNREFRYPYKLGYAAIIVVAAIMGLVCYGFFMDAYSYHSIGYMVAVLIIFGVLYYYLFVGYRHHATKIIINDDSLIIDMLFKEQTVVIWKDIKEFGRYKVTSAYSNRWVFYAKTITDENKKILLFSEMLVNGQDLVDAIFLKATNAKFVVLRNISLIPFIRKTIIEDWKEASDLT